MTRWVDGTLLSMSGRMCSLDADRYVPADRPCGVANGHRHERTRVDAPEMIDSRPELVRARSIPPSRVGSRTITLPFLVQVKHSVMIRFTSVRALACDASLATRSSRRSRVVRALADHPRREPLHSSNLRRSHLETLVACRGRHIGRASARVGDHFPFGSPSDAGDIERGDGTGERVPRR